MAPNERDVAAIRLLGGTANKITNDGTIYGDATPSRGTAILADSSSSNNTINKGTIHGNIIFEGGAGNVVTNLVGGVISAPTTLNLSGGVLQNAGTLHVGGIGTIGTTTLTGDLVQSSPGSVHIDIDPARGRTDLLQISGRAALDGAIVVNPISVHKGTSGPVITAAGGLTVAPLLQGTTGLVFTHSLLVLGNSLSIATDADFKSNDLSKSTNQRGAAGHLQRIWDSGATGFDQGFLSLSRLSSVRAYTLALDSLSGEVHASTAGVLVDESRYMRGAVLGRLRQASYGGYTGMAPLAFGGPLAFADGEELSALAYAKSPVVKAPLVAPSPTSDIVFWTQGFGAWGRFEGDGNAASVRRDLAGFITGVDTRVGTNGRAGIAAGYIGSRNNLDGRGSANVETGQVAAYGGWSFGAVNLRAGGAYAFHAIDTDRTIAFPGFFDRATARYDRGHRADLRRTRLRLCVRQRRGRAVRRRRLGAARHRRRGRTRHDCGTEYCGEQFRGRLFDARHPRRQSDPDRRRHGADPARLRRMAARVQQRDAGRGACVPACACGAVRDRRRSDRARQPAGRSRGRSRDRPQRHARPVLPRSDRQQRPGSRRQGQVLLEVLIHHAPICDKSALQIAGCWLPLPRAALALLWQISAAAVDAKSPSEKFKFMTRCLQRAA